VDSRLFGFLARWSPGRFSPAFQVHVGSVLFDRSVRRVLPGGASVLRGFASMALRSFEAARRLGYRTLELESASAHVCQFAERLRQASTLLPYEPSPVGKATIRRVLREYAAADVIWVTSRYSFDSFVAAGVPPEKLRVRQLRVPSRFRPATVRSPDGVFRVVSTGSITPGKGTPIVVEAFRRLDGPAELVLVGYTRSRGMRRWLAAAIAADPRVRVESGDPLPWLQRADAYVHPSFQDGFGYAPMEALACGVPVVVTEDTGMGEHVVEGVNGYVVPTGEWEPVLERLRSIRSTGLRPPGDPATGSRRVE